MALSTGNLDLGLEQEVEDIEMEGLLGDFDASDLDAAFGGGGYQDNGYSGEVADAADLDAAFGGRTDQEGSEGYYDANPYGGGLLDGTNRSGLTGGGMMDYSDMTGLTEDDLDQAWGRGSTRVYDRGGYNYSGDMNLAMAHAYDQRFSDPNHAWNQLTENEKRNVVTREQAGPSWLADKFNMSLDSRLNNLINSEVGIRTPGPGDPGWDRDDTPAENACVASGGTWDGGQCTMPEDDPGDNGDDDGFGDADPFASLRRLEWTHPMLGYGQDAYSGQRPDYVSDSIWDYKPPQLTDWTQRLKTWGGV